MAAAIMEQQTLLEPSTQSVRESQEREPSESDEVGDAQSALKP